MLVVNKIPWGDTYLLELRNNTSTDEYVTVIPELGACLHQVCPVCEEVLHPLLWAAKVALAVQFSKLLNRI